jgi:drug/metabolite transporter (DMT)-like permease
MPDLPPGRGAWLQPQPSHVRDPLVVLPRFVNEFMKREDEPGRLRTWPMVQAMSEDRLAGRQNRADFDDGPGEGSMHGRFASDEPDPLPAQPEDARPIVLAAVPGMVEPGPSGWLASRRHRFRQWWRGATPNLRGSIYMVSALLVYAVMVGLFKYLGPVIPLVEILMIRQVVMSLVIIAFAARALPAMVHTERPGLQVFRGLVTLASMLCGFSAIIYIPLAQATAIGFSQVLFVTIAAVLVLKEKVDAPRWIATIIGFVGVIIMLNPSTEGLNIYALMSVGGALFGACITISVRMLATSERTDTILIWQGIVLIVVLAVPTWWFWVQPTPEQWLWLVVLSLFGTAGQWLITRAYQVGEAAALAPIDFSRLLLASFTGFVFFAEIPALPTWIGATFVIGATLYTMRKNARPLIPAA